MPVKRKAAKVKAHRITPEAVAAFKAHNYMALHQALGLRPWEASPLPANVTALGVDQDEPPAWMSSEEQRADWRQAQALQRELLAALGK